jgi:membrane protease YdiL (CAAX protease family)
MVPSSTGSSTGSSTQPNTGTHALRGVRALAARRPLTVFLALVLGVGWPILALPGLAHNGLIPGGDLPDEPFALAFTLLVLLPAALWVTAATEGRAGVRALLRRAVQWRFGLGWYVVILLALPIIATALGVLAGGSFRGAGLPAVLLRYALVDVLLAVVVINLWEETGWAGFLQARLERRHGLILAALLTAVPFALVHVPLLFAADEPVLAGAGFLLSFAVVFRLLAGLVLRGTAGSVLAVGLLHATFNATNNTDDGMLSSLLTGVGVDGGWLAPGAAVVLTGLLAVVPRRRSTSAAVPARPPATERG